MGHASSQGDPPKSSQATNEGGTYVSRSLDLGQLGSEFHVFALEPQEQGLEGLRIVLLRQPSVGTGFNVRLRTNRNRRRDERERPNRKSRTPSIHQICMLNYGSGVDFCCWCCRRRLDWQKAGDTCCKTHCPSDDVPLQLAMLDLITISQLRDRATLSCSQREAGMLKGSGGGGEFHQRPMNRPASQCVLHCPGATRVLLACRRPSPRNCPRGYSRHASLITSCKIHGPEKNARRLIG